MKNQDKTTQQLLEEISAKVKEPLTDEGLRRFIDAYWVARNQEDLKGTKFNSIGALNSGAWAGENLHFLFAELLRLRKLLLSALLYIETDLAMEGKALSRDRLNDERKRVRETISKVQTGRDIFAEDSASVDLAKIREALGL